MPDPLREREWLDAEELESGAPGLPRPDLNPLVNSLLGDNMGRWAQVYFTSPPDQRERAVEKLLQELKAEAGNKKKPRPEATHTPQGVSSDQSASSGNSHRLPNLPKSKPEREFPELPIQTSPNHQHDWRPTAVPDLVVCPSCLHKNAAEQRFCGTCGVALNRELAEGDTSPLPAAQAEKPPDNAEADWQWLRERSLSSYEVKGGTGSHSRFLLLALVLLAISVGAYFLWQNRARLAQEQAPSSASSSAPPAAPSMNLPMSSVPPSTPVQQSPGAKPQSKAPTANATAQTAIQNPATNPGSDSSGTLPSDDGRTELGRARQYLAGDGVPRNSWMASQLLWKAIGKQNSDAVLLLSDLYARGDGVPRSCEQARILLVSAAKKGSSAAAQKLRSVETRCR